MKCSVLSSPADAVTRLVEIISPSPNEDTDSSIQPRRTRPNPRPRGRRAPSPNGNNGKRRTRSPSPNGQNGDSDDQTPSPNGNNGDSEVQSPSPNGDNGDCRNESPSPNGQNGRDERGRFTKGNAGGPGNPFARRIAALRSALCAVVTEKDIQELARQLLEQAKIGDLAAVKILFAYAIGRPTDAVDPDSLDVKEWQHFRQSPVGVPEMEAVFAGLPPDMASAIVGAAWPGMARQVARWMAERLKEDPNGVSTSPAKSGRK